MFHIVDDADEQGLKVQAIHDERGYRRIRRALARQYDVAWLDPDIQVMDVDLSGDRRRWCSTPCSTASCWRTSDAQRVLSAPGGISGATTWC